MAPPSAEPVCRIVFSTPEAAPASLGSTFLVAIVCIGDMVQPMPRPATRRPGSRSYHCEAGPAMVTMRMSPAAYRTSPLISRYLPPRSARRPANGAASRHQRGRGHGQARLERAEAELRLQVERDLCGL